MAYEVNRYDKSLLTTVENGTVDNTTDLTFVGKNYNGYGEAFNENSLFLLENFSSPIPPSKPISGQLWHDSASDLIKLYNGTEWKVVGAASASTSEPTRPAIGSFWWNTETEQLYVYGESGFILIGPQTLGSGVTQMISTRLDSASGSKVVIAASISDEVVAILSPEEFTIAPSTPVDGFTDLKKGITLKGTPSTGITEGDHRFWGTASDSERLGGVAASDYLTKTDGSFETPINFESGLTIGDYMSIEVDDVTSIKVTQSSVSGAITFSMGDETGVAQDSLIITSEGIMPGQGTSVIGSDETPWDTIYANSLQGTATQSDKLLVNGTNYRSASTTGTSNSIVARDASANITANVFNGVATSARYADLAEKYTTDQEYPVGTVMEISDNETFEAQAASGGKIAIGVISEKPAYLMNSEIDGQAIALVGRVPVLIEGPVTKGQIVHACGNGHAKVMDRVLAMGTRVGIALETNYSKDVKLVECILKVN